MGNKYTKAYFKCPTCGGLKKDKVRGANNRKQHDYKCVNCGTVANARKIKKLGDESKFSETYFAKVLGGRVEVLP